MSWTDTNEPVTDDPVHQWLAQAQQVHNDGSSVLEDCDVTPGGTLTVNVADGYVFVNGAAFAVTAANKSLVTEQGLLTAGQAQHAGFYIDSAGAIQYVMGTAATGGTHVPPALPNRTSVPIALVTIAFGDTVIDAGDIAEWRIHASQGAGFIGPTYNWREAEASVGSPLEPSWESRWYASRYNAAAPTLEHIRARAVIDSDAANQLYYEITDSNGDALFRIKADTGAVTFVNQGVGGDVVMSSNHTGTRVSVTGDMRWPDNWRALFGNSSDLSILHDSSHSWITNTFGSLVLRTSTGALELWTTGSVQIVDDDDGDNVVVDFDTNARTISLGTIGYEMATTFYDTLAINNPIGSNPVFSSNDVAQILDLQGRLDLTSHLVTSQNLLFMSGTGFAATLDHANTGTHTYTFPDKAMTVADNADLHAQSHVLSGSDHTGDIAYSQVDAIVDVAGGGTASMLNVATHTHTAADGSSKVPASSIVNGTNNYVLMAGASTPEWQQMGTGSDVPAVGNHTHTYASKTQVFRAELAIFNPSNVILPWDFAGNNIRWYWDGASATGYSFEVLLGGFPAGTMTRVYIDHTGESSTASDYIYKDGTQQATRSSGGAGWWDHTDFAVAAGENVTLALRAQETTGPYDIYWSGIWVEMTLP